MTAKSSIASSALAKNICKHQHLCHQSTAVLQPLTRGLIL